MLALLVVLKNNFIAEQLDRVFLYLSFIPVYVNLAKLGGNTPIISLVMKGDKVDYYIASQVCPILIASIIIPIAHGVFFGFSSFNKFNMLPKLVLITFLLSLISLFVSIYQARGDYIRVYLLQGVYSASISLPLLILIGLGFELDENSYFYIFMFLSACGALYVITENKMWGSFFNNIKFKMDLVKVKNNFAYFINDSMWYLVIALCSSLVIANLQSGALSEFTIALRFGMTLVLVQQATNLVFGPRVAKNFLEGKKAKGVSLFLVSMVITSVTALALIIIFYMAVDYFDILKLLPIKIELLSLVFSFVLISFLLGPSENVNIFLGRRLPIILSNVVGIIALICISILYPYDNDVQYYIILAMSFMLAKKITNTASVYFIKNNYAFKNHM